ncbi:unnamed protein product [Ectocarpus sp. 12 AP-2014]
MSQDNPAYVPVGGEFVEGRPVALPLHRQRDARGVVPPSRGRRKEWWWQPGPVDTVGFCWDLDMGVGITAAFDLVGGILSFVSIGCRLAADTSTVVAQQLEEEFAKDCEGLEVMPYKCKRLINRILHLTLTDDILVPNVMAGTGDAWRRKMRIEGQSFLFRPKNQPMLVFHEVYRSKCHH